MPAAHPFEDRLARSWPPDRWRDVKVVLAVSGGADSVALLRAMTALRGDAEDRLVVAHLHHGLRGEEADADQHFVQQLCLELGVSCHVGRIDVQKHADEVGDGVEAAARSARYDFLQRTAERLGARYVATAHTADDQAETILHHVLRGSGLSGLSGMPRTRPLGMAVTLIRPMLRFRRSEVIDYLDDIGQSFREDATNLDPQFTRNRIRHQLLPSLAEDYNPAVITALLHLAVLAGEAQQVIDELVEVLHQQCVQVMGDGSVSVDCGQLAGRPPYLVRQVLIAAWRDRGWPQQGMGFAEWNDLASMTVVAAEFDVRPRMFPGGITVSRHGKKLRLQ